MISVGIITPADLPVPSIFGGAIETLIDNFIIQNEKQGQYDLIIYSKYDEKAAAASKRYLKTRFRWVRKDGFYRIISILFRILRKLKIIKTLFDVWIVYQLIKKDKPDIVIVEGNLIYVKFLNKRLDPDCRIIFHIHALLYDCKYLYLAEALEHSDSIIVVSNYVKSYLIQRFQIDQKKIKVVYNCASETFFNKVFLDMDKVSLKNKLELESTEFVLIFAGRLVPEKGLLELIKACKTLINQLKIKLLIIGSFGSDFGKLNNKKNAFEEVVQNEIFGLERNFIFCGYIANDEISDYYAIADVTVVPSLCEEAAGLVAIEAMSSALPVIYSNKGGIPEYVSQKCGIMVDMAAENCIDQIATAILTLHDNYEMRKSMSAASFQNAKQFTPKSYYENLGVHINDLKVKRVAV